MNLCIRGINGNVVKAIEVSAQKRNLSREEYLRQCLERVAYDDRALENRYQQRLQKLILCIQAQQQQLEKLAAEVEQIEDSCIRLECGLLKKTAQSNEVEGTKAT